MAMAGRPEPPDAVILGCTTGGILTTEQLLRDKVSDNKAIYRYHGLFSVAEDIAELCRCTGPALTVSTACSSGAVAIALAMNLLRSGRMRRILAGGVDSLSRLTYFGFHSLQLVDRNGCRPLDVSRQGLGGRRRGRHAAADHRTARDSPWPFCSAPVSPATPITPPRPIPKAEARSRPCRRP